MVYVWKIFSVCLLAWGCQGQSNGFETEDKWLSGFYEEGKRTSQNEIKTCIIGNEEGQCVKKSECMVGAEIDLSKMSVYRELGCHYLKTCCPKDLVSKADTSTPAPMPKKREGCGWSNPGGYTFRDSSNTHAEFGEFPWMVALLRTDSQSQGWNPNDYIGGGTLIHPSVVMTIAHKVKAINDDPLLIKCRLGEWDTQTTNEIYPHQERNVRKILVHEQFSPRNSANNIALLITSSPFDMTDPHVGIACLSSVEPKKDAGCYSMGWGKDFNDNDKYALWLKKVPLPIVDHSTCEYALQGSRLTSRFRLHNTLICAGGRKNFDTCTGDGGSPLVCGKLSNGAQRYSVYGMVAFGVECGTELPAAYVNIASMIPWITKKFFEESIDIRFYP